MLFTVPTAFRAVRKEDPEADHLAKYDVSSLKRIFLAGERLDPPTYEWLKEHTGLPVLDHWWQTETGWAICCNPRSEEHTSELQSRPHLVCRLLLEKKKKRKQYSKIITKKP